MTRRYRQYTRASDVVVRNAESGEVIDRQPAYEPLAHRDIVAKGNKQADPSRHARKRRSEGGR